MISQHAIDGFMPKKRWINHQENLEFCDAPSNSDWSPRDLDVKVYFYTVLLHERCFSTSFYIVTTLIYYGIWCATDLLLDHRPILWLDDVFVFCLREGSKVFGAAVSKVGATAPLAALGVNT